MMRKYKIHPLAISSICDNFTRSRCTTGNRSESRFGILFGSVNSNDGFLSVEDAADVPMERNGDISGFDALVSFIAKKTALTKAVFPAFDFVGCYSVESEIRPYHADLQHYCATLNANAVLLLVNPAEDVEANRLPLNLFEWQDSVGAFIHVPFKLESTVSERIAVEEIFSSLPLQGLSAMEAQNTTTNIALLQVSTLSAKLLDIVTRMKSVRDYDRQLIRILMKVSKRISSIVPATEGILTHEIDESMIITCASSYCRTLRVSSELSAKFSTTFASEWATGSSMWYHGDGGTAGKKTSMGGKFID